ncbi:MAG: NnrS family protein [Actinobacteria bacterium]|nr:NnrS family protein [Actinomycetota bacterium]
MNRPKAIYDNFVIAGIVSALTAGCTLGATMLILKAINLGSHGFTPFYDPIIQSHGHFQIFGWMGLFIMGIAYFVVARFKATEFRYPKLAVATLWLMATGIVLRVIFQPFISKGSTIGELSKVMMVLSSVLELTAVSIFLFTMLATISSSQQKTLFWEKYAKASFINFLLIAIGMLSLTIFMVINSQNFAWPQFNAPLIHFQLLGFIAMIIFGVAVRTLPIFLGSKRINEKISDVFFWVFLVAILLRLGFSLFEMKFGASIFGILDGAALVTFPLLNHIFSKPQVDLSKTGVDLSYVKLIKGAYFWLVMGGLFLITFSILEAFGMNLPHEFWGAFNHIITVGFASQMVIGYGTKLIPTFRGVNLAYPILNHWSFGLINTGNTLRVTFQMLATIFGGFFYYPMGISGWLEVTAILLFGINLIATLRKPISLIEVA